MFYNQENPEVFNVRITKYKEYNQKEVLLMEKSKDSDNVNPVFKNTMEIYDSKGKVIEKTTSSTLFLVDQNKFIKDLVLLFSYVFNSLLDRTEDVTNVKVTKRKNLLKLNKPTSYSFKYKGLNVKIDLMISTTILVSFGIAGDKKIEDFDFDFLNHNIELLVVGNEDHISWMLGWNNAQRVIEDFFELNKENK